MKFRIETNGKGNFDLFFEHDRIDYTTIISDVPAHELKRWVARIKRRLKEAKKCSAKK